MRRPIRWNCTIAVGVAVAAIAVGLLGSPRAGAGTAADPLRSCGTFNGPSWTYDGVTDDEWRFIATENVPCFEQRPWIRLLAPRIMSTGTVDVVRFNSGTWSCLTARTLALGYCNSLAGEARLVFVMPASPSTRVLKDALVAGGAGSVLGPVIGSGTPSGPRGADDEPQALRPSSCTARPGSYWNRTLATGNLWLTYAGGGITCLAAQGWVSDVSGRLSSSPNPVQFNGGDGWRCIIGPNAARLGKRVGACARTTNWRTSLEPRAAIIAGGVTSIERTLLLSTGYDAALWLIAGQSPPSFSEPRTCSTKGVSWRVGSSTGNRWLVGAAGGYPCPVAAAAAAKLLERTRTATADQTNLKGVRDKWSCRFVAVSRTTACTWSGSNVPRSRRHMRMVFTPVRSGAAAIVDAALVR